MNQLMHNSTEHKADTEKGKTTTALKVELVANGTERNGAERNVSAVSICLNENPYMQLVVSYLYVSRRINQLNLDFWRVSWYVEREKVLTALQVSAKIFTLDTLLSVLTNYTFYVSGPLRSVQFRSVGD